ncbi:MAG: arginine--tRNA ligase [Christensenellales bacterium]|jgi:arginyl-tRNA synthetase
MNYTQLLAGLIAGAAPKEAGIEAADVLQMIENPPERKLGDFALPCFKLSRALRKASPAIAQEMADIIRENLPEYLERVEAVGGYLNFYLDRARFAENTLSSIFESGENYGSAMDGNGRVICIDFSSINIAKPFHIGHLSSTAIGNALTRIYTFLGYKTVGINHLGDWGTQFGKLIVAFKKWGDKEEIERDGVSGLLKIYVRFHDEAEKDEALGDEARAWFRRIEDGDEEAMALFEWFKDITLKEVQRIYDLLDVHFDSYAGESFYNDKIGGVLDELEQKNLLERSQGALVVDLAEEDMPPCMILKADGATLYATRDIAAAIYRRKTYGFHKSLYVVAYQQNLHFQQFFKVLEKMGYDWAKDMVHVAFGMVSLKDATLSTRRGNVVFLQDVLDSCIDKARQIMLEKSPELENPDETARQVGVGALVFQTLSAGRIKDITFTFERALNFDGETGPYVQYTHARCCSVLKKAPEGLRGSGDPGALCDEEAQSLLALLARFPQAVSAAAEQYEPSVITRYVVDVAQAYNKFYYEHQILCDEKEVRDARLALTEATRSVIRKALYLIGLHAPQSM